MTYTMKPSQIYEKGEIWVRTKIEGYRIIDFRPPKGGELYLSMSGVVTTPTRGFLCPCFILERTTINKGWWE
jgi:hypothetical protein